MKITKIKLFNVPFRYSSQDRIIENVDEKIQRWAKTEFAPDAEGYFEKVSYSLTNAFEGTITINSPIKYNYARIESDLYNGAPIYVFLISVATIESSEGFTYNVKLDVMASFGKTLFNSMNGKNVLIDRLHEDRYVYEPIDQNMYVNPHHHGLISSDFQIGETAGQVVAKQFANVVAVKKGGTTNVDLSAKTISDEVNDATRFEVLLTTGSVVKEIVNSITVSTSGKKMYVYAIITAKGAPIIESTQINRIAPTFKNDILICPVNTGDYSWESIPSIESAINLFSMFELLGDGKVLNIVSLPFQLIPSIDTENGTTTSTFGSLAYKSERVTSSIGGSDSFQGWTQVNATNDFVAPTTQHKWRYLIGFPFNKAIGQQIIENLGFNLFNKFQLLLDPAHKALWKSWLQSNDFSKYSRFEIGMLNKGITPLSLYHDGQENPLDFYSILRDNPKFTKKWHGIKYVLAEDGFKASISIDSNQFVEYEQFNPMSFYTDAGASYLAQNAAYMNAQKRGVELQGEMQKLSTRSQRWQNASSAANPISAIMSLGTSVIGGGAAAAYNTKELGQIDKITENEKNKIDAHIQDLQHTSPIAHAGNGKAWSWAAAADSYGRKFIYLMRYPNEMLAKKIYFYIQKHGYKVNDWFTFSENIYKNRVEWNMLTISNAQDYVPQTEYDESIVNEFVSRLGAGVRIWHKDDFTIDYTKLNLEKSLESWLNS